MMATIAMRAAWMVITLNGQTVSISKPLKSSCEVPWRIVGSSSPERKPTRPAEKDSINRSVNRRFPTSSSPRFETIELFDKMSTLLKELV